jgi:hypothetical protein
MPQKDGTLTDEEFALVQKKIADFYGAKGGRGCRVCGNDEYFIHPSLIGNRSDTVGVLEPHTRQPTVMIYCQTCGLVEHFVAWVLGVETLKPDGTPK